jgi:hypothetical protein
MVVGRAVDKDRKGFKMAWWWEGGKRVVRGW